MDLRKYYLERITEEEYYYNFYELISNINQTCDFLTGDYERYNYHFIIDKDEDIIEKFKELCRPDHECHNSVDRCWFYLILFYLKENSYVIEEFPRLIEHPPLNTYDFVNVQIREKLISEGKVNSNGGVPYSERRNFVKQLTFKQLNKNIELKKELEQKIIDISNRNAPFQKMSTDEKLAAIANAIENLLKKNEKEYIVLDYSPICFEYINDEIIKKYRHKIQCFRHASSTAMAERKSFNEEQKKFLVDYGVIIINSIATMLPK